jgi:secreted trypsin-like serine protease
MKPTTFILLALVYLHGVFAIEGGTIAEIYSYPFMASLQQDHHHDLGYRHFCGPSIGNSDTLITAAHCVFGLDANDFIARVGSTCKYFRWPRTQG